MEILIKLVMFVTAMFLVVLILLQRGRGGGLAGALGGAGGQSAFGSKTGDVFTRITSGVAIFWIVLCVFALGRLNSSTDLFDSNAGAAATASDSESLQQGDEPAGGTSNTDGAGKEGAAGGTKRSKAPAGKTKPAGGTSTSGEKASGGGAPAEADE